MPARMASTAAAICSAIGYAYYLQRTAFPDAEAACCGEINARTQFALTTADQSVMSPVKICST